MEKIDIPFWKNDRGAGYKHGKPIEINGVKYWASLYQNEPKSERTPLYKMVLNPVEEQAAQDVAF